MKHKIINIALITFLLSGTFAASIVPASADSSDFTLNKKYALRYSDALTPSDADDSPSYQLGWVDNQGRNRAQTVSVGHLQESVVDDAVPTIQKISNGGMFSGASYRITRSPYQNYDVGETNGKSAITTGFMSLQNKLKSGTRYDIKWIDTETDGVNESDDSAVFTAVEVLVDKQLYRVEFPPSGYGYSHYYEDVSSAYTTPFMTFSKNGNFIVHRAPMNDYTVADVSGTVVTGGQ